MAQISNLYRRSSGIYAVRLVVPVRLRREVGKGEVHLSTGSRTLAIAKTVACGLLAHWREKFLKLDGLQPMNLERIVAGSPALSGGGYMPLVRAAGLAGLDPGDMLRKAAAGQLRLFVRLAAVFGHVSPLDAVHGDLEGYGVAGGTPEGPLCSEYRDFSGIYRLRNDRDVASSLLIDRLWSARIFDQLNGLFSLVADDVVSVTTALLEVEVSEVEAIRAVAKASVTGEQLAAARAVISSPGKKASRSFSEALDAYMVDKSRTCAPDHARRVRSACDLFAMLEGNPRLDQVDRDRLREYVGVKLAAVPARANQARATHGD